MKQLILSFSILLFAFLVTLSACDEGKKPNIAFKTGAGNTSVDTSVGKSDTLTIGITASKAEKTT